MCLKPLEQAQGQLLFTQGLWGAQTWDPQYWKRSAIRCSELWLVWLEPCDAFLLELWSLKPTVGDSEHRQGWGPWHLCRAKCSLWYWLVVLLLGVPSSPGAALSAKSSPNISLPHAHHQPVPTLMCMEDALGNRSKGNQLSKYGPNTGLLLRLAPLLQFAVWPPGCLCWSWCGVSSWMGPGCVLRINVALLLPSRCSWN